MSDGTPSVDPPTRRSFLSVATASAGVVAAGAAGWGLLGSLAPSADVTAQVHGYEIPLSDIAEGTEFRIKLYGLPILIRHRTQEQIEAAEKADVGDYPFKETLDVYGRRLGAAHDQLRRATPDGRFIALVGRIQEFDCVPLEGVNGDFDGWFEPCRGNHYDTSGRLRKGPANENLRVPNYELVGTGTLRLIANRHYVRTPDLDDLLYR